MTPAGNPSQAIDDLMERAYGQLEVMNHAVTQMNAIEVTKTSTGGEVEVTVDGMGALKDLKISGTTSRWNPSYLTEAIITTSSAAMVEAMEKQQSVMRHFEKEFTARSELPASVL